MLTRSSASRGTLRRSEDDRTDLPFDVCFRLAAQSKFAVHSFDDDSLRSARIGVQVIGHDSAQEVRPLSPSHLKKHPHLHQLTKTDQPKSRP